MPKTPDRENLRGPTATPESRLRLQTSIRLRWFAVVGQLIAIGSVYFWLQFALPIAICLVLIALSAWLNVYLRIRYANRNVLTVGTTTALLMYDLAQLSILLFLTGGIENPFVFLIIAPVVVAAATLPSRETIIVGTFAAVAAVFLVPLHLPLPWGTPGSFALPFVYQFGILASVLTSMMFLSLYAWRLSKEARLMSAALAATEIVLGREQKLQALDGLAAAAAHELGTPLSTIAIVSKELEREINTGSTRIAAEFADDIHLLRTQVLRCREILQRLAQQPSEQDPMHATVSVTQVIDEAAKPYRALERSIIVDAAPDPAATGPAAVEPVGERRPGVIHGLGNLIENASEHATSTVHIVARWSASQVQISIEDDGPGISPEILDALGEPYVTSRSKTLRRQPDASADEQSGLGLGFFIAKTLIERSGARVTFGNRERGVGAVIRIIWSRETFELSKAASRGTWPYTGSL